MGKTQLGELAAEMALELGAQRGAVERLGLLGIDLLGGAPLHEQPLDSVEGRQRAIAGAPRIDFGCNAEEIGEEVVQRRRQIDDQIGIGLGGGAVRRRARRHQPVAQFGIAPLQEFDETPVERRQAIPPVKSAKRNVESENEIGRHGDLRMA